MTQKKALLALAGMLLFLVFLNGCAQQEEKSQAPEIAINSAQASPGKISLSISSASDFPTASIQISTKEGAPLCGKTLSLKKGENSLDFNCQTVKEITVMVLPEGQKASIKDFNLSIPALEFKKGMLYGYAGPNKERVDVYVTDETDALWKGIIATTLNNVVAFTKFELDKEVLSLHASSILKKEDVEKEAALQPAFLGITHPFGILVFQQQFGVSVPQIMEKGSVQLIAEGQSAGTVSLKEKGFSKDFEAFNFEYSAQGQAQDGSRQEIRVNLWTSTKKPYLLVGMQSNGAEIYALEKAVEKGFSLEDYAEFNSYEPPKELIELAGQEVLSNGQINIALKNNYSKPFYLKYFKIAEQQFDANIELAAGQITAIPIYLNAQVKADQQYQFSLIAGIQMEGQIVEFTIVLEGKVREAG